MQIYSICHWPSHQLLTKALSVRRLSEASFWSPPVQHSSRHSSNISQKASVPLAALNLRRAQKEAPLLHSRFASRMASALFAVGGARSAERQSSSSKKSISLVVEELVPMVDEGESAIGVNKRSSCSTTLEWDDDQSGVNQQK